MRLHNMPVLLTGVPQSGASLVAKALRAAGYSLGPDPDRHATGAYDADSYGELPSLRTLNDRVLEHLGLRRNPSQVLPENWSSYDSIPEDIRAIRETISKSFALDSGWVIKDPRLCSLLPIYLSLDKLMGTRPTVVVCVRNPLNVAEALERLEGMPNRVALGHWLHQTLSALHSARSARTRIVLYEAFLEDPTAALAPILDHSPEVYPSAPAIEAIMLTVNSPLERGRHSYEDLISVLPTMLERTYDLCVEMFQSPDKLDKGEFDGRIAALWSELMVFWSMGASQAPLTSQITLSWRTDRGEVQVTRSYIPAPLQSTIEIPFDAPGGAVVFGSLSVWPATFHLRSSSLTEDSLRKTSLRLEPAPDLMVTARHDGEIWELPRSGMHFRFFASGGQQTLALLFSCRVDPDEVTRMCNKIWHENSALKDRLKTVESKPKVTSKRLF